MSSGYREEVFNVLLALLLHQRDVITAPEQSFKQALQERRHVPDVLVVYQGLRTVIEGKVADRAGKDEEALKQARDRVESGIAHIGIALLYPREIRKIDSFSELQNFLSRSTFKINVCSEAGESGWAEGGADYLADALRNTYDQLVKEDVVTKVVAILDAGVTEFARLAYTTPDTIKQAAEILGIHEIPKRVRKKPVDEEE